jgi:thiosulfate dehydrogenase [quinone] large subunit
MESKGGPGKRKRVNGGSWPPARHKVKEITSDGTTSNIAPLPLPGESSGSRRGRRSDVLRTALRQEAIYLLPLRLLVAVAWLWTYATRIAEPGWRDGSSLTAFFTHQLDEGLVVFPHYRTLITEAIVPHAAVFAWVLLIAQLVVGISLLFGAATRAALLVGIAINLNQVLAGSLEVAVLAIAVQVILLLSNAGSVLSVDEWFGRFVRISGIGTHQERVQSRDRSRWIERATGVVAALAVAVYGGFHAVDWRPPAVLHDPAAMLTVLAVLVAVWLAISLLRAVTGVTAAERETVTTGNPGWPAGWEPLYGIAGDSAAIEHLGTADLEWGFRSPLPEWSAETGWRRQG